VLPAPRLTLPATRPERAALEEGLGRQLLALDRGLGLFRLVHLLDALGRSGRVRTVLSIGSGEGLHEAYLANAFPDLQVAGVDIREPPAGRATANLRLLRGDLRDAAFLRTVPAADFVFSIECLEHLDDDESVFRAMAGLVKPGGRLYLQVPFASEEELSDPELCRQERERHEHVRPGYSEPGLRRMAERAGLRVLSIGSAFWYPMQPLVWIATDMVPHADLAPHWRSFLELAAMDLGRGLALGRTQACAIKLLAARPV